MAAVNKRPPVYFTDENAGRYERISKSAWADLYADLYRQTHGDNATETEIMDDAENRLRILQDNRIR